MWFSRDGGLRHKLKQLEVIDLAIIEKFDKKYERNLTMDDILTKYGTLKPQEGLEHCTSNLVLKDKKDNQYSIFRYKDNRYDEDRYAVLNVKGKKA